MRAGIVSCDVAENELRWGGGMKVVECEMSEMEVVRRSHDRRTEESNSPKLNERPELELQSWITDESSHFISLAGYGFC